MRVERRKQGRRVGATKRLPEKWGRLLPRRPIMRTFRMWPDPIRSEIVEVRLTRTRRAMHAAYLLYENEETERRDEDCMGRCRSWHVRKTGRPLALRRVVARIYLNACDIARKPSEIPSHEAAHAAMAFARLRRANLAHMPGEEIMCHALGRLVAQINHHLYAAGVFRS